jgi:hypothetical protein
MAEVLLDIALAMARRCLRDGHFDDLHPDYWLKYYAEDALIKAEETRAFEADPEMFQAYAIDICSMYHEMKIRFADQDYASA